MTILKLLWLIPAAPLFAAFCIIMFGKGNRAVGSGLAILAQLVAFLVSAKAFATTLATHGFQQTYNFTWFKFGDEALRIGWILDPLTAGMLVMVTFVSFWIFVFSKGYMEEDPNFSRFFAYLSLFSMAMLGLVLSNNLLLLFVFWELVGLASYLLIGFWIHKPSAAAAAKKAFITTRIGDIGFFIGILWLYKSSGKVLFYDGGNGCLEGVGLAAAGLSATAIALLIFCGACGKSGQFPLHVWLPDAMEGPTPVSALIHAATMVAAGVFLVARMFPLFTFGATDAHHPVTTALTVVVWVGVVTAFLASLIAIGQDDIKRILAYSTVSQLGLMMVSLGVGGFAAGIIHLLAHGFFKALLFLGSGSVIHGCHHEQDIRKMGGLKGKMPVTFMTYSIGMMALCGVPFFFCGAWSKEEVINVIGGWPSSKIPFYLMLGGVFLTSLYMSRQMVFVFFGNRREASSHAHESPLVLTLPLMALAACSVLLSILLTPAWPWLAAYLEGEEASHLAEPLNWISIAESFALVALGMGAAAFIYKTSGSRDPIEDKQPALFRLLQNKFWIDEIYEATVLSWSRVCASISNWLDRYIWDGLVRLVSGISQAFASLTIGFDEGAINNGGDQSADGAQGLAQVLSSWHSGQIQTYLRVIGVAALALFSIYLWIS